MPVMMQNVSAQDAIKSLIGKVSSYCNVSDDFRLEVKASAMLSIMLVTSATSLITSWSATRRAPVTLLGARE